MRATRTWLGLVAVLVLSSAAPALAWQGPLGELFGGLFKPVPKKSLDLIDQQAPAASADVDRGYTQLNRLIGNQNWDAAAEQIQHLLDQPEDSLIRIHNSWHPMKRLVETRLLSMPEEGRRAYRSRYEAQAARDLEEARARDDLKALARVSSRFRMTPSGEEALNDLMQIVADSGDLVTALSWAQELQKDNIPVTQSPEWTDRMATWWTRLGQPEKAPRPADSTTTRSTASDDTEVATSFTPSTDNWTGPYGGPSRLATQPGERPLLLEEWAALATQDPGLYREMVELIEDLDLVDNPTAPIVQPVLVNGLLAQMTVGGLKVRDVGTGRTIWSLSEGTTAERLMSRDPETATAAVDVLTHWDDPDTHPLSSMFYRDAVLNQLTSDGRQVFQIGSRLPLLSSSHDLYSDDLKGSIDATLDSQTNTLDSYDLKTGDRLWSIGGPESHEAFAPPLTGVYFFGPPAVAGHELFVIGYSQGEVNLYCLDAATGHPLWKQMVAQSTSSQLNDDNVRKMWACIPTVTPGMVYCQTGTGWLTAVDRRRHRIAWATRYVSQEIRSNYASNHTLLELNSRWPSSAPLISRGVLVVTPPELPDVTIETIPQLFRIDAISGRIMFARDKDDAMSVGGIFGETVLVIGKSSLEAWPITRKRGNQWSTRYPGRMTPCGQGVAVNNLYWMPFREGALVSFRLDNGKVDTILQSETLRGRLGNLYFHRGRVLSISPLETLALWQVQELETEQLAALTARPGDPVARYRAARQALLEDKPAEARKELALADLIAPMPVELKEKINGLAWSTLCRLATESPEQQASLWPELERQAKTENQQFTLKQLEVDRLIKQEQWAPALELCWTLAVSDKQWHADSEGLQIQKDAWLARRFRILWEQSTSDIQQQFNARLTALLTPEAIANGSVSAARWSRLIAYHPRGHELSFQLALTNLNSGAQGLALMQLEDLSKTAAPTLAASAITQLVTHWKQVGSDADSKRWLKRLDTLPQGTLLPDGTTVSGWKATWLQTHNATSPPAPASWRFNRASVQRMGSQSHWFNHYLLSLNGPVASWVNDRNLQHEMSWEGVSFTNRLTGEREWTAPLPEVPGYEGDAHPTVVSHGTLVALSFKGMLHLYSPLDRKTVWSTALPSRFYSPNLHDLGPMHVHRSPAMTGPSMVQVSRQSQAGNRMATLMAFSEGTLVILGQRQLIAFDLLTGAERWRRDGISPDSLMTVSEGAVCVTSTLPLKKPAAFRLDDGTTIASHKIASVHPRMFAATQTSMLIAQKPLPLVGNETTIAAELPLSGTRLWSHKFPQSMVFKLIGTEELIGISPDGEVVSIDVSDGELTSYGRIPPQIVSSLPAWYILSDDDRIYVAAHSIQSFEDSYLSLTSLPVSGSVTAFDRSSKSMVWNTRVIGDLIVEDFRQLPCLLVGRYRPQSDPNADEGGEDGMHLSVLDKQTGTMVVNWKWRSAHNIGPDDLKIDPVNRWIDLLGYMERYRIFLTDDGLPLPVQQYRSQNAASAPIKDLGERVLNDQ